MWKTLLNIVDSPRLHPASFSRIRRHSLRPHTSELRLSPTPRPFTDPVRSQTCNIRRLIRRLCSALNRISAKANNSRSSQAICSR